MNKAFYKKAVIHYFINNGCTDEEREGLLDLFEGTMKRMATTVARKAWFETKDYYLAERLGVTGFKLMIKRLETCGEEQWRGVFRDGQKQLEVLGTLENTD